jgi:predicted GNAT family acetyltransferase
MSSTKVINDPEKHRYELIDHDQVAGIAAYELADGAVKFTHTEVADEYEGKGYGSELAEQALKDVSGQNKKVIPVCPFIAEYIQRHPKYADLVVSDS